LRKLPRPARQSTTSKPGKNIAHRAELIFGGAGNFFNVTASVINVPNLIISARLTVSYAPSGTGVGEVRWNFHGFCPF
jgi:hypothetical protein